MCITVRDITAISMYMVSMVIITTVTIMQAVRRSTHTLLTILCMSSILSTTDTTWVVKR